MSVPKWMAICLIVVMQLTACNTSLGVLFATPTPTPTITLISTLTAIATATPWPTVRPTLTAIPCDKNETLKKLKALALKAEIIFNYTVVNGVSTLAVWFVEPALTNAVNSADLVKNNSTALQAAAEMTIKVLSADVCASKLFQYINPVIVDSQYHGYFSGQVSPLIVPKKDAPTAQDIQSVMAAFTIGYSKLTPPSAQVPAPAGSCTWIETEAKIHQHFSPDQENVSFYLVIDETGVNVWAQWDGPADQAIILTNLLNITQELNCLYPRPQNLIYVVVDETGQVLAVKVLQLDKK